MMNIKEFVLEWFLCLENDYADQEKCRSIIEKVLLKSKLLYLWLEASSCKSKSFG